MASSCATHVYTTTATAVHINIVHIGWNTSTDASVADIIRRQRGFFANAAATTTWISKKFVVVLFERTIDRCLFVFRLANNSNITATRIFTWQAMNNRMCYYCCIHR